MNGFPVADTALIGFRFARAHPKVLAAWAGASLAFAIAMTVAMVTLGGGEFTALANSRAPEDARAAMAKVGPVFMAIGLVSLCAYAFWFATMNRAVLRPVESRAAYFRLGRDELRQGLLMLLGTLLAAGCYIVVVIVAIVAVVPVALLTHGDQAAVGVAVALAMITATSAMVFLAVRFSLASALTFDRQRVDLFGSWRLTRGRFWKMLGCFALVGLLAVALTMLLLIVQVAIGMIIGGPSAFMAMARPDLSSLHAYFTPGRTIQLLIGAAGSALIYPVMGMPAPEIYRQITRGEAEV